MSTGLNSYVGFAEETTWGTFVGATDFIPANSSEFTFDQEVLKSEAIVTGLFVQDQSQTAAGKNTIGGRISYPLYRGADMNLLLEHALGSVSGAGTAASKFSFVPASQIGKGLSITIGKPRTDGTVVPMGYSGCKIKSWSIGFQAGAIATIDFDFVASSAAVVAAPTVSQTLPSVYAGVHGALTVATVARNWSSLTISGDNKLDEVIYGGSNDIVEPLTVADRDYMIEATVDFNSSTDLNTYLATPAAQALVFTATAGVDVLEANVNAILKSGGDPAVSGKDRLTQSLVFECYANLPSLLLSGSALLLTQWDSSA